MYPEQSLPGNPVLLCPQKAYINCPVKESPALEQYEGLKHHHSSTTHRCRHCCPFDDRFQ